MIAFLRRLWLRARIHYYTGAANGCLRRAEKELQRGQWEKAGNYAQASFHYTKQAAELEK